MAHALCEAGQWMDLLDMTKIWVETHPNDYLSFFYQGVAYSSLNLYELSERSYQRCLDLHSDDPRIWGNLGLLHQNMGKMNSAEAFLQRAYQIKPWRQEGLNLALFYAKQKKMTDAADVLKSLIASYPSDPVILEQLVAVLYTDGNFAEIVESLDILQIFCPEIFQRLEQSDVISEWRKNHLLLFEGYFCSFCNAPIPRKADRITCVYRIGELQFAPFTRKIWCNKCLAVTDAVSAGQSICKSALDDLIQADNNTLRSLLAPTSDREHMFSKAVETLFKHKQRAVEKPEVPAFSLLRKEDNVSVPI
jgi:tetratricopeptide (TPR) repeat protein